MNFLLIYLFIASTTYCSPVYQQFVGFFRRLLNSVQVCLFNYGWDQIIPYIVEIQLLLDFKGKTC